MDSISKDKKQDDKFKVHLVVYILQKKVLSTTFLYIAR